MKTFVMGVVGLLKCSVINETISCGHIAVGNDFVSEHSLLAHDSEVTMVECCSTF